MTDAFQEMEWRAVVRDDRMRFQLKVMGRVQHSLRDYGRDDLLPVRLRMATRRRWSLFLRGFKDGIARNELER